MERRLETKRQTYLVGSHVSAHAFSSVSWPAHATSQKRLPSSVFMSLTRLASHHEFFDFLSGWAGVYT